MVGNGLSPEQIKAIEAELAEHTAYRALLAAAEAASAEVMSTDFLHEPYEKRRLVLRREARAYEDLRDAARARKAPWPVGQDRQP